MYEADPTLRSVRPKLPRGPNSQLITVVTTHSYVPRLSSSGPGDDSLATPLGTRPALRQRKGVSDTERYKSFSPSNTQHVSSSALQWPRATPPRHPTSTPRPPTPQLPSYSSPRRNVGSLSTFSTTTSRHLLLLTPTSAEAGSLNAALGVLTRA